MALHAEGATMYAKCFKRIIDLVLSFIALALLLPFLLILTVVGAVAMGGNPLFVQERPGRRDKNGNERIFRLIKFRTMSNKRDESGAMLPDDVRLNKYGRFLRKTSLDELPELINILKGDMSIVGPRPLLVEYLPYYTSNERRRHDVRPGLTGWAQVNGRNALDWDKRFLYDLEYVDNLSLAFDLKIVFLTFSVVLKRSGVHENTQVTEGNLAKIRKTQIHTK